MLRARQTQAPAACLRTWKEAICDVGKAGKRPATRCLLFVYDALVETARLLERRLPWEKSAAGEKMT